MRAGARGAAGRRTYIKLARPRGESAEEAENFARSKKTFETIASKKSTFQRLHRLPKPTIKMSTLQPIKLYSHDRAPNPFKVRIVLEKLGLPYTSQLVDFSEVKKPAYEAVNPNGR